MSQLHQGRPEAAEVIWNWRGPQTNGARIPAGNPRLKGAIQGLVGMSVALAIHLYGARTIGTLVFCVSTIVLLSALLSPTGIYRAVEGLFTTLGNATGRALTWLMLVPLFYLFFLPFGFLLRRGRRDQLKRRFEPDQESYWEPHKPFSAADHERQF